MIEITIEQLLFNAYNLKEKDHRLLNIICTPYSTGKYKILYLFESKSDIFSYSLSVKQGESIESISKIFPCAILMEQEMYDQFGIKVLNSKPIFRHTNVNIKNSTSISTIPFGPQHPLLIEPMYLKLYMNDERIVDFEITTEYLKKGIEKFIINKNFTLALPMVERLCGKSSTMHSLAFCQALEKLQNIEIPSRAKFLRVIWSELNRIQSHMYNLAFVSYSIGFESLYMQILKIREHIMNIIEKTTGGRVISSINVLGGTKLDIDKEMLFEMNVVIGEMKEELDAIYLTFMKDYLIRSRLKGVGVLSKEEAVELGVVGPVARASGIKHDLRITGYAAYDQLDFEPIVKSEGDCYARAILRLEEIYQSADLIEQSIDIISYGDYKLNGEYEINGECISRVEEAGGDLLYYVDVGEKGRLKRVSIRNSSTYNVNALYKILSRNMLADVPTIILSLDLSLSGMER